MKKAWTIIKGTVTEFGNDRAVTLGAALAYYAMFSIAPLLVIIVGVAGLVFQDQNAQQKVVQQLQGVVGQKAAGMVQSMMSAQHRGSSLIATIIGVIVLLLGASGLFGQLKTSLNLIWGVKPKPDRGILGLVLDRLVSILLVLGIGILLMASMVLTSCISIFYREINQLIHLPGFVAQIINLVVSLGIITLLFAVIFKVLPDVRISWRNVWVGAFTTALLFVAGEYLLSLYLHRQGTTSSYGAAGSVVLLLMWIYYSSLILFIGAEFTQVYAQQTGARIEPGKFAMPLNAPEPQPQSG